MNSRNHPHTSHAPATVPPCPPSPRMDVQLLFNHPSARARSSAPAPARQLTSAQGVIDLTNSPEDTFKPVIVITSDDDDEELRRSSDPSPEAIRDAKIAMAVKHLGTPTRDGPLWVYAAPRDDSWSPYAAALVGMWIGHFLRVRQDRDKPILDQHSGDDSQSLCIQTIITATAIELMLRKVSDNNVYWRGVASKYFEGSVDAEGRVWRLCGDRGCSSEATVDAETYQRMRDAWVVAAANDTRWAGEDKQAKLCNKLVLQQKELDLLAFARAHPLVTPPLITPLPDEVDKTLRSVFANAEHTLDQMGWWEAKVRAEHTAVRGYYSTGGFTDIVDLVDAARDFLLPGADDPSTVKGMHLDMSLEGGWVPVGNGKNEFGSNNAQNYLRMMCMAKMLRLYFHPRPWEGHRVMVRLPLHLPLFACALEEALEHPIDVYEDGPAPGTEPILVREGRVPHGSAADNPRVLLRRSAADPWLYAAATDAEIL